MAEIIDYVARSRIDRLERDFAGVQDTLTAMRTDDLDELKNAIREHHERAKAMIYMGVVPLICSVVVILAEVIK